MTDRQPKEVQQQHAPSVGNDSDDINARPLTDEELKSVAGGKGKWSEQSMKQDGP